MKFGYPKWKCPNCSRFIKFNYLRANIVSFILFFVCIILIQGLQAKLGWDLPDFIFLIPYFILSIVLLSFDKLEEYKE